MTDNVGNCVKGKATLQICAVVYMVNT